MIYKLRAIVLSVRSDGLVKANEEFTAWLRGERSMPFGPNHEHVTIHLLDFADLANNQYVATSAIHLPRRGCRTACRSAVADQRAAAWCWSKPKPRCATPSVGSMARCKFTTTTNVLSPNSLSANVFSVATEGKDLRYGSIHMPVELWGPWRLDEANSAGGLNRSQKGRRVAAASTVLLDILTNFTLFATDKKKRRLKVVCRYQQYDGANRIVERVLAGYPKKG